MSTLESGQSKLEIPSIVAKILSDRGVSESEFEQFLYPSYDEHLNDPMLLTDMDKVVARVGMAATKKERVVVYGDYDIDGITASAVMLEGLLAQGIEATSYIPDRFEEGYGINLEALQQLQKEGTDLVISVDCGITSIAEIEWANANGLDVIITDHHSPLDEIPQALAVVNPKRPGDFYPFKDLCGAGVAFKVVQALQQATGKPERGQEKWLLDLVALGTVCDVVNLVGENRVLVYFGLKVMRHTRRKGLRALAAVAGVDIGQIQAYHLGFILGPRLNAAGRLVHADASLELLRTRDVDSANQIAGVLDDLNRKRREDQDAIFEAADVMAAKYQDDPILVLADESWSHGIVGIVASKLVEKYHKPTLIMQIMGDSAKGSARSTGSFNMVDGLQSCSEYLDKFGGHFFAAGYSLPTENIDALRYSLNAYFKSGGYEAAPKPKFTPDGKLSLSQVDWELYQVLARLEPYGMGNMQPIFEISGIQIDEVRPVGSGGKHLKLGFSDGNQKLAGIGFGLASKHDKLKVGQKVSALGRIQENTFQGLSSLQFQVLEIME